MMTLLQSDWTTQANQEVLSRWIVGILRTGCFDHIQNGRWPIEALFKDVNVNVFGHMIWNEMEWESDDMLWLHKENLTDQT